MGRMIGNRALSGKDGGILSSTVIAHASCVAGLLLRGANRSAPGLSLEK